MKPRGGRKCEWRPLTALPILKLNSFRWSVVDWRRHPPHRVHPVTGQLATSRSVIGIYCPLSWAFFPFSFAIEFDGWNVGVSLVAGRVEGMKGAGRGVASHPRPPPPPTLKVASDGVGWDLAGAPHRLRPVDQERIQRR